MDKGVDVLLLKCHIIFGNGRRMQRSTYWKVAGWLACQSELVQMLCMGGHGGFPSLLSFLCNAAFQLECLLWRPACVMACLYLVCTKAALH